ncbi:hypothetical protein H8A95_03970 [Bradyrhizobium sp. Pear76]|uniref:hypothetical protein n=1 Tax=Bradyrhizobium oropedii TaxID=1571201 RepID=UPI001E60E0C4|nr:hypothetical protein [Bradyrhizobium oropedii]MCC8961496.1 hypothetical protein [Bradyrhizobium oropedii]
MQTRRRFKQTETLQQRLAEFAAENLKRASNMPAGVERDNLIKRARQANAAAHIDEWISSPGLQSPK